MMGVGVGLGLAAIWLDGWKIMPPVDHVRGSTRPAVLAPWTFPVERTHFNVAGYLAYYALAFFVLRWWKLADRRRTHRFSFTPILAAAFWGLVLLPIWPEPWRGTLVLITAAAIIQVVSPWDQPPPPVARRMRLRYA
jgi:hypothetical protein